MMLDTLNVGSYSYHLLFTLYWNYKFILELHSVSGQIDYEKQTWKISERAWSAIEDHQERCRSGKDYYDAKVEKLVVSAFIGRFKFSGFDPRSTAVTRPNTFRGSFPQPPLKLLDPIMARVCRASSSDCVHYVFKQLTAFRLEKHQRKHGPKTYPGRNYSIISVRHKKEDIAPLQLFHFQTTAMYFLCYWSIMIDDPINDMQWSCRYPGKKTNEELKSQCFLNAVCPSKNNVVRNDPCCGNTKVINTNRDCEKLPDGICSVLLKKPTQCQRREGLLAYEDIGIDQFIRSGPAYDCQCPETYTWNLEYLTCIDEDECLSKKHKCDEETQYCVNRVQGYFCACQWGYYPKSRYQCQAATTKDLDVAVPTNQTITEAIVVTTELSIDNLEEFMIQKIRDIVLPLVQAQKSANFSASSAELVDKFNETGNKQMAAMTNAKDSLFTTKWALLTSMVARFNQKLTRSYD